SHPYDGLVQADTAGRAAKSGVPVVEDAPVRGHEPVALAVGGGSHPHDGPVEGQAAGGAVEGSVPVVDEAAAAARSERVNLRRRQYRDQAGQDDHDRQYNGASETEIPCPGSQHYAGSTKGQRDGPMAHVCHLRHHTCGNWGPTDTLADLG